MKYESTKVRKMFKNVRNLCCIIATF